jgi:hypothetical protein
MMPLSMAAFVGVVMLCLVSCRGSTQPRQVATISAAGEAGRASPALPQAIGVAEMKADRTIVLMLRASRSEGGGGEAMFVYPPGHPRYSSVLEHLGGLQPGESKPVPPWPETPDQKTP